MTTRYLIEDGMITRQTINNSMPVPLATVFENMKSFIDISIDEAPKGLRSIRSNSPSSGMIDLDLVIEQDPTDRHILYKNAAASSTRLPKDYLVNLPYCIFWFKARGNNPGNLITEDIRDPNKMVWNIRSWGLLWSKEPYKSGARLYRALMPNLFTDSKICFGANSIDGNQTIGAYIDTAINKFWTSEFNADISTEVPHGSMETWHRNKDTPFTTWEEWNTYDSDKMTLDEWVKKACVYGFSPEEITIIPRPTGVERAIPETPTYPTFDNMRRWLGDMTPIERNRIMVALDSWSEEDEDV